jgi:ribonuclease HII
MLSPRYIADDKLEAGVDEAGRGCFWGDMFAAAVIWPAEADWTDEIRALVPQIRDSKKISPKKRERICDAIMANAVAWAVGRVSSAEIDEHGMTWANQTAFARALADLKKEPQRIIIDGILGLPLGCAVAAAEVHTVVEADPATGVPALKVSAAAAAAAAAADDACVRADGGGLAATRAPALTSRPPPSPTRSARAARAGAQAQPGHAVCSRRRHRPRQPAAAHCVMARPRESLYLSVPARPRARAKGHAHAPAGQPASLARVTALHGSP